VASLDASVTCNVGNDEEISIDHLARTIHTLVQQEYAPVRLPARPHDHLRRCPDLTLIRSLIGPLDHTSLTDGLHKTIAFYRNRGPGTPLP
jgi:nucleoside-diphosphate-sugar epimerase